jgi:hypothetical protein
MIPRCSAFRLPPSARNPMGPYISSTDAPSLSCSAMNVLTRIRPAPRLRSSLRNAIPAASANETSANSSDNRTSSATACTSHARRSSSTEEPVIRPSTRRVTALFDDSTTVTLSIAVHLISSAPGLLDLIKQLTCPSQNLARSEPLCHDSPRSSKPIFG